VLLSPVKFYINKLHKCSSIDKARKRLVYTSEGITQPID